MSRPALHTVLRRITRRDLLRVAPIGAVAAGTGAVLLAQTAKGEARTHQGTCRFCLMHCGIRTTVESGRLVKVEGDLKSRTRGFVCEHGFALRELLHSGERLNAPLIRRGDQFHEVEWAEAIGFVAERLNQVKARHGGRAFAIQTGWPLVRHPLVNWLHRFARAYGSPNVASVASLCEASLRMGQALTVGSKYAADVRGAKTLVLWGANPAVTAPPFAHVIASRAAKGNLIVIDPVRTQLARDATMHLSIRPGTDGALALGLIHLIVENGWYNERFVREQTIGFDELRELAKQYPPERVQALTSIDANTVQQLARKLGTEGPVGVWQGLGVEHHENGVQTVRAIASLEALVGRFDGTHEARSILTPSGGLKEGDLLPALYRMETPEPVPPQLADVPIGRERFPLFELYNREAQGQLYADAILKDRPYPLRAMMLVASNALVTSSGSRQLSEAVDALDLLVVIDPFFTASARRADVVLPATLFAEAQDVADDDRVAEDSLAPAHPGAWSDWRILTSLAKALGLERYFPWATMAEAAKAPHVSWMHDEAMEVRATQAATAFGTPSGKVELASTLLAKAHHPPLPEWTAPNEQPTPEFPLRLVTGPRPRAYINSQFHASPSIRTRMSHAEALVHPTAVVKAGLSGASHVRVISPHGAIELVLVITDEVHPETVILPAGFDNANVNLLIDAERRDAISGFPAFRSGICRLERVSNTVAE